MTGSPVSIGLPSAELKKFIDSSVSVRNRLENKVATLSAPRTLQETRRPRYGTLTSSFMHGMVVCGDPISSGGHYGADETGP